MTYEQAKSKKIALSLVGGLLVLSLALWFSVFTGSVLEPSIYFIDVGQGDSQLVVLENNIKVLIDGGPPGALAKQLASILPSSERYIDLVINSHPELDHMGGLIDVLKNYQIGAFVGTGRKGSSAEYQALIKIIKGKNIPYITLHEGSQIRVGESIIKILSPSSAEITSANLNDTATVAQLKTPSYSALFTGDINFATEARLVGKYDLQADILKIAHHGSKYSSSKDFLDAVNPQIAVIEVGKNNYGHPTQETLNRIEELVSQIFQTNLSGTIRFTGTSQKLINHSQK